MKRAGWWSFCAVVCLAGSVLRADEPAKEPAKDAPKPQPITVITIYDEKIVVPSLTVVDGRVALATEPPRQIPLDELATVEFQPVPVAAAFGAAPPGALAVRWIGQDNHDLAQPDANAGPNGIQDLHLQIVDLAGNTEISQIVVQEGTNGWRLDPGKSNDLLSRLQKAVNAKSTTWKLAMVPGSGFKSADLYLEPARDHHNAKFVVTVTYANNQVVRGTVQATTATSKDLKMGEKIETPAAAAPATPTPSPDATTKPDTATPPAKAAEPSDLRVIVHLDGASRLSGVLTELAKESLKLRLAVGDPVEIPLAAVRGIWFEGPDNAASAPVFAERLREPAATDVAIVRGSDGAVTTIEGAVEGLAEAKLKFEYEGQVRPINQARVMGLVFSARPKMPQSIAIEQVFELTSGDRVTGTWTAIGDGIVRVEGAWGRPLSLPQAAVARVTIRNGKLTYLSDLEPAAVEEVSFLGRPVSYHRDQNLAGGPLKLKTAHRKGLAVHARTVLTYTLDGHYATFKSMVGFDETPGKRGRVKCRVLGDGRELFTEADLKADQEPKSLELDVKDVKQLTLEVDFGEEEDVCDRVIWGDARLFRAS